MRLLACLIALAGLAAAPGPGWAILLDDGEVHVLTSDVFLEFADEFFVQADTLAIIEPGTEVATTGFGRDIATETGGSIHVNGGTIGKTARWQLTGPGEFLMTSGEMDTSAFAVGFRHEIRVGPDTPFRILGGTWYRTPARITQTPLFEIAPEADLPDVEEFADLDLLDVQTAMVRAGNWDNVTVNAASDSGATLDWDASTARMFVQSGVLVTIEGGVIDLLLSVGEIDIEGGTIGLLDAINAGTTNITGGEILELDVDGNSLVRVEGSDFNYPNGPVSDLAGTLTGTLADGTPISAPFVRDSRAELRVVPEPSSAFAMTGALLSLGALSRRRPSGSRT